MSRPAYIATLTILVAFAEFKFFSYALDLTQFEASQNT